MSYTPLVSASSGSDNKVAQAQLPAWWTLTPWVNPHTENIEEYGFWLQQNLWLLFLCTGWYWYWRAEATVQTRMCSGNWPFLLWRESFGVSIGWLWEREDTLLYKEEKITSLQGIPIDSKINIISALFSGCWWEQWSW